MHLYHYCQRNHTSDTCVFIAYDGPQSYDLSNPDCTTTKVQVLHVTPDSSKTEDFSDSEDDDIPTIQTGTRGTTSHSTVLVALHFILQVLVDITHLSFLNAISFLTSLVIPKLLSFFTFYIVEPSLLDTIHHLNHYLPICR